MLTIARKETMPQTTLKSFFRRHMAIPLGAVFLAAAGNVSTLNDPPPPEMRPLNSTELRFKNAGDDVADGQDFVLATATTEEVLKPVLDKTCYRFGEGMAKAKQVTPLLVAINALKSNSKSGEEVFDLIYKDKIRLCYLKKTNEKIDGLYLEDINSFVLTSMADVTERPYVVAHELLHYAQNKNGLSSYAQNTDIHEQVRQVLTMEAAATTLELLIAYDEKLNGNIKQWEWLTTTEFEKGTGVDVIFDSKIHHSLESTYQQGIQHHLTRKEALRAAGKTVFEHVFNNDSWRKFYINRLLVNAYISIQENNGIFADKPLTQNYIDLAGKIDSNSSFTRGAKVPAFNDLFKHDQEDKKMYWIYEAANFEIHSVYAPTHTKENAALLKKAYEENNPYIGLSISKFVDAKIMQDISDDPAVKKYDYLYQFIDAKLEEKNQSALKKDSPVQAKKPAV
jgi:hypothetical protein